MKREPDHYGQPKPAVDFGLWEGAAAPQMPASEPPVVRPTPVVLHTPQWKRVLYAISQRPSKGMTRHEIVEHFAGTSHPIPLASVCRVVGEKLLRESLVEVSEIITRASKAHHDNQVLFITPRGRSRIEGK